MKLSIVDLSVVFENESRHEALNRSIELARFAEEKGFTRIWYAEHHGGEFVGGRAPEIMIAAVAAHTNKIRLGSGSVLLNHYSPFKVAEVFCTLNELYPGRIDLGAGRATTGPVTDLALQQDRSKLFRADSDQQIAELVAWLEDGFPQDHPFAGKPIYTSAEKPTLFLLGSSNWSASAAAALGLRYVIAGFINPNAWQLADVYRTRFSPAKGSSGTTRPELILSVHVVCADTEEEAAIQLAPVHVMYRNLSVGKIDGMLPSPDEAVQQLGGIPAIEKYNPGSRTLPRFVGGSFASVSAQLKQIAADYQVEELMIQDMITDADARIKSYELLAQMMG